jgi:perosamine synthetase
MQVPAARVVFDESDRAEISRLTSEALASGSLTLGRHGREFEQEFAAEHGAPHAVAVSSGTAALELALRLVGVTGGDVIVPSNTFFATAAAATRAGARVVFADVDAATFSLTPETVARAFTPRTRAVVVVHIGGLISPDLPALAGLCRDRNVPLIEDAAHAHGCSFGGRYAGSFGRLAAFSFYPTKVITSGEGGMLVTAEEALADEARIYRDQGKASFLTNAHVRPGYAWRMSELHAITGRVHLRHLTEFLRHRAAVAARYDDAIAELSLISSPARYPASRHNYYKYVAMLPEGTDRQAVKTMFRDEFSVQLSGEVYDLPLHLQPVFRDDPAVAITAPGGCPVAEDICSRHVCLPVHSDMTHDEVAQVIEALSAADAYLIDVQSDAIAG